MRNKRLVFVDLDTLVNEGYTSGVLIRFKEMLELLSKKGFGTSIIALSSQKRVSDFNFKKINNSKKVEYYQIDLSDKNGYQNLSNYFLKKRLTNVIVISPAVILELKHIYFYKAILDNSINPMILFPDVLYPNIHRNNPDLINTFFNIIKSYIIFASSNFIKKRLFEDRNIESTVLPSIFSFKKIIAPNKGKYITLINHHPLKGRVIFDRLATLLPKQQFLIVENWKESPKYHSSSNNVKFSHFQKDVKNVYKKTKILLVLSLVEEAFGRVVIEGLLNGIPIVAHDIGGISEASLGLCNLIPPLVIVDENLCININKKHLDDHCEKISQIIYFLESSKFNLSEYEKRSKAKSKKFCLESKERIVKLFSKILVYG